MSDVISPHSITLCERGERIEARGYAASVGAVTLAYLRYGASVRIQALDVAGCFCVQIPLVGSADVVCGAGRLRSRPGVASVPPPVEPLTMTWSRDAEQVIVRLDASTVYRHLEAFLGHPAREPLRPRLDLALTGPNLARWRSLTELLHAEIANRDGVGDDGATASPTGASASAVEELALNALLLWHPNNYWEHLRRPERPAQSPHLRRAIEYARANLALPLPVTTLASVAGVSVRALQAGFRRELGCSPARFVRHERLNRARDELLAAGRGDTQVTTVALKWGFTHLGRFAANYREQFGEHPSTTLHR